MRPIDTVLVTLALFSPLAFAQAPSNAPVARTAPLSQDDAAAIRQIEDDLLKAERTTDPAVIERVLADDFIAIRPHGLAPGNKAQLVRDFQNHHGQAPPYAAETHDLNIYLFGNTAIAAYVKIYTANENGNIAKEDDIHVFIKDQGMWKLKVARASNCQPGE